MICGVGSGQLVCESVVSVHVELYYVLREENMLFWGDIAESVDKTNTRDLMEVEVWVDWFQESVCGTRQPRRPLLTSWSQTSHRVSSYYTRCPCCRHLRRTGIVPRFLCRAHSQPTMGAARCDGGPRFRDAGSPASTGDGGGGGGVVPRQSSRTVDHQSRVGDCALAITEVRAMEGMDLLLLYEGGVSGNIAVILPASASHRQHIFLGGGVAWYCLCKGTFRRKPRLAQRHPRHGRVEGCPRFRKHVLVLFTVLRTIDASIA